MTALEITRLRERHAVEIVNCFTRVYGDTYANRLFYDARALADALTSGRLGSVGAVTPDGRVLGHMAMTVRENALSVELGNTVVDPVARGEGLAWRIGNELSAWCRELGYPGFLHYPTTDHHIMQRHSVVRGFETGLMLGYIPEATHGKVGAGGSRGRQAATIVYEPYGPGPELTVFAPARYRSLLEALVAPTGLSRHWRPAVAARGTGGRTVFERFGGRDLERLDVARCGSDLSWKLAVFGRSPAPCLQLDFSLDDPGIESGVELAVAMGFGFCGWLPGYHRTDVLRLQRVDVTRTDLAPKLENATAASLLAHYRMETA